MKAVTKDQFFDAIGNRNVHPELQPGPWPYTSIWKDKQTTAVVGKSVQKRSGGWDYFLTDDMACKVKGTIRIN